jgi:hypothetical protein
MKKRIRNIEVEGRKYIWQVSDFNGDGDWGYRVKIWHEKEEIYNEFFSGLSQPKSITPKWIRNTILEITS